MDSMGKAILGLGAAIAGAGAAVYFWRKNDTEGPDSQAPSSIPTEMPVVEPQEALPNEALYQTPGDNSFSDGTTAVEETPSEPPTAPAPSAGLPPYSKDLLVKAVLVLEKAPLADRNTLANDFGAALKQYTKPQQLEMLTYGRQWFTTLSATRQQQVYAVLVSAGMGPMMQQVYQAAQRRRAANQKAEEDRAKNEAAAILKQQEAAKQAEESRKMAEQLAQQQAEQQRLEQ